MDALNDPLSTTLNDLDSEGPGDVTWAFQWDISLAGNQSFLISRDKLLTVPEPGQRVAAGIARFGMQRIKSQRRYTHEP